MTVFTTEECHFGKIDKSTFDKCLKESNEKKGNININILLNNQIFTEFSINYFRKNYFSFFVEMRYDIYEKIVTEGSLSENIYFIKNGQFELSFKKSLIEINEYIKFLGGNIQNEENELERMNESPKFNKYMNEKKLYRVIFLI